MMSQAMIKQGVSYRGVSEVARRVRCSQSHLSRVLRGERKPGKELAKKLARMGVDVEVEEAK